MSDPSLPSIDDFADAEHCVLEDVTAQHPTLESVFSGGRDPARELRLERSIVDRLRRRKTTVRLYAEGWADIESERQGRLPITQHVDLRYLDAVPSKRRYRPTRLLKAAGICAGVTGVAAVPALIGWVPLYSITTAAIGLLATLGLLAAAFYMCHEKIVFKTLHGRADALRLSAGLGTMKRFDTLLPEIVTAIASAAEDIHDRTAVYLRAEMHEHYRLRNEGILSAADCAASTGRILEEFDGKS